MRLGLNRAAFSAAVVVVLLGGSDVRADEVVADDAATTEVVASDSATDDAATTEVVTDDTASLTLEDGGVALVDDKVGHWGMGLVPRITYNSDYGLGLGVRGSLFWYRWGQKPYKTSISFQLYGTTRLVQEHYIRVDAIDAFNLPVRLFAEVGYYSSIAQNYCGLGNDVSCDLAVPRDIADRERLLPHEAKKYEERFYQLRFIAPYAKASAAWRLARVPDPLSVFVGYRAQYYQPGDLVDEDKDGLPDFTPYPGSLYANDHPDGEVGLASVAQIGVLIDGRDNEPAPRRGYVFEAALRGAHPFMLSRSMWGGGTLTGRTYVPLWGRELVLASRYVLDVMVGDPPIPEMYLVGGLSEYSAYGGQEMGRGIRVQRFIGRVKTMMQHEVRLELPSFSVWEQNIRPGFAAFLDVGKVSERIDKLEPALPLHLGFGISLRIAWNENFVMRVDLAVSPDENYRPTVYSAPNHPY